MSITVAGRTLELRGMVSDAALRPRPTYALTLNDVTYEFGPYGDDEKYIVGTKDGLFHDPFDSLEEAVQFVNWIETVGRGNRFEKEVLASWKESLGKEAMPDREMVEIPASHLPSVWLPGTPANDPSVEIPPPVPFDTTPSGKRGRMDLFALFDEETEKYAVIGEIKDTNWDRIKNLRRRLTTMNRQVWKYVSAAQASDPDRPVYPAIIFSKRPEDPARLLEIERFFDENMVAVVWSDETIEERAARGLGISPATDETS